MVGSRFFRAFDSSPEVMESPTALVLVAFIALLVFQSWALWLGQPFDPYSFGTAAGMALGGGGVASYGQGYMMRSRTMFRGETYRATAAKTTGSAVVDNPDGGT